MVPRRALLVSGMVLLLACGPAPPESPAPHSTSEAADTSSPAPSPNSSAAPRATTGFSDDFEDPASGWSTQLDAGEARYVDGAYETVIGPGAADLSPAPATVPGTGSVSVRVDAQRLRDHRGQFGAGWGVACGEDFAGSRFYWAIVQVSRGVGYPGLFRWNGPGGTDFEVYRKADERHSAVRPDGINELELRCIPGADGITVVFLINGIEVGRGIDRDPPEVDEWETGLYIDGSPLPKGNKARIRWDNYEVLTAAPEASPASSPDGDD